MFSFLQRLFAPAAPAPVVAPAAPAPVFAPAPRPPEPPPVEPPVRPLPPRGGPGPAHDLIALVGFAHTAAVLVEPAEAYDYRLQQQALGLPRRATGTGTDLAAALDAAADLLARRPRNHLGRLWVLTDGLPTCPEPAIDRAAAAVNATRSNINTIGFGDSFDAARLRRLAAASHNGRFVTARTLRQLTDALLTDPRPIAATGPAARPETTVIAIDLSASMTEPMEGCRKIDVAAEALLRLLAYKQRFFA